MECIVFFDLQVKFTKLFIFFLEMSSIRSFPFLLGIFLSFFLTSCIPDPGWEEKDDFIVN